MNTTSEAYNQIGLHDAQILHVIRTEGAVEIALDSVALIKGHPANRFADDHLICEFPTLRLVGVTKETARAWDDERREWTEHKCPTHPLDGEIMEAKYDTDHFFFDGFDDEIWSEWRIWATGFVLSWDRAHLG